MSERVGARARPCRQVVVFVAQAAEDVPSNGSVGEDDRVMDGSDDGVDGGGGGGAAFVVGGGGRRRDHDF